MTHNILELIVYLILSVFFGSFIVLWAIEISNVVLDREEKS